jgi:hypothetical protein
LQTEAAFGSGRIDFEMDAFVPLGIDSFCIQIAVSSVSTDKKSKPFVKAGPR